MNAASLVPVFQEHRPLLFGIAYRMLGSVTEAQDMVQEVFLRWQSQPIEEIKSPKAWLTTTVTRLCIDHLRSARVRREEYVGVWLPEPLLEAQQPPAEAPGLAESLTTAFLVLLETLSPAERAVFLLREVFEYDYDEIARITEKSEANCRQMLRRAKEHVAAGKSRFKADAARNEQLVQQFMDACRLGDTEGLLAMLSDDATLYSDGGGKVLAAVKPIFGADRVSRFLVGVMRFVAPDEEFRFAVVNSEPGLLRFHHGQLIQTTTFALADGRITAIYVVRNPDKLRHAN
ncbi:MAG TPA: RNA polymerase sigma-70 factor [Chthoniobacteraceae bacterium]|nr:RNA polymerase sigma-70 factor [Chthoniobacteraceae bacterium]